MKSSTSLVLIALLALPAIAMGRNYAWWVNAEFSTTGDAVLSLPLQKLNGNWCEARALQIDDVPVDTGSDFARQQIERDAGRDFIVSGDFNGDGETDTAAVGVYKDCEGQAGRFLIILDGETEEPAKVKTYPGKPGFSILSWRRNALSIWFCLECDNGYYIHWTQDEISFSPGWPEDV